MISTGRLIHVIFVAALAGTLGVGSAVTPAMAADPVFTVVSARYSASTVTVSGVQTRPLTVTVHITATPAIPTDNGYLGAKLGRTAGTGGLANSTVWMNLVSGDGTDGVWAGTFAIPSTAAGTWTLGSVLQCRFCQPSGTAHPVTGMPTFTVVGTYLPRLSAGQSPNPTPQDASPFTIKGRATDSATGAGIPGVRVGLGYDYGCMPDPVWQFIVRVTNSLGYYGFTILSRDALQAKQFIRCMAVLGPHQSDGIDQLLLIRGFSIQLKTVSVSVSAVPARPVVPVGTRVQVNGNVISASGYSAYNCTVVLQRLTGTTQWRGQSSARARLSGRYTLIARPLAGRNIYRALFPACHLLRRGSSVPFIITAN